MAVEEEYLGDGAYVRLDFDQVEIYASNGIEKTNSVYLGPHELTVLLRFARQFWKIEP